MIERTSSTAPSTTAVKTLVLALVAMLLAGALYLIAVRGDALMIDLAKIGQALCL